MSGATHPPAATNDSDSSSPTFSAPSGRVSGEGLRLLVESCVHHPVCRVILEAVDGYVMVLNEQRQVVAANSELIAAIEADGGEFPYGLRPGEVLDCSCVPLGPDGCGTAGECSSCGALLTLMASRQTGAVATGECLMNIDKGGIIQAREFHVRATPLEIGASRLTVFLLHDISAEKRRDALENIFIHDLLSMLSGLGIWATALQRDPSRVETVGRKIVTISRYLSDEVRSRRLLLEAEKGELDLKVEEISVQDLFADVHGFFSEFDEQAGRRIELLLPGPDCRLRTNRFLLTRVLINMLRNGLEGSPGGTVHADFRSAAGGPLFSVSNPAYIPAEVAERIFHRAFSTKGVAGRGLGTYSMKLFVENYMKGKVWFTTDREAGTTFFVSLPPETVATSG